MWQIGKKLNVPQSNIQTWPWHHYNSNSLISLSYLCHQREMPDRWIQRIQWKTGHRFQLLAKRRQRAPSWADRKRVQNTWAPAVHADYAPHSYKEHRPWPSPWIKTPNRRDIQQLCTHYFNKTTRFNQMGRINIQILLYIWPWLIDWCL